MSRRFYPRNEQSRADAVANNWSVGVRPRNEQSRLDGFAQDAIDPFESRGGVSISQFSPFSLDEISVSSAGFSTTFTITSDEEKWAATLGADNAITTAFLAGITSAGLGLDHTMLERNTDKLVTLTVPAVESLHVEDNLPLSAAIPASAFQYRDTTLNAGTFGILGKVATVTCSAALSFTEAEIVAGGNVIDFFLGNGVDSFQASPNSATINQFVTAHSFAVYDTTLTVAVFSLVSPTQASITLPADAGYTIAADAHIRWTVPRSMFNNRKASYAVGTVAVVVNA